MSAKSDDSAPALPRPVVLALAVATVAVLVFAPSLGGEWIYDDHSLIFGNAHVHGFHAWRRWFSTDFFDVNEEIQRFGSRMVYWRPAVSASYALDWKLGGGEPIVFHLTNLVWHGLASVLAFVALRRWIGAILPAFLAALLFAVHPTKAESVAWIAGRTDVLCLVAILIAGEGIARRLRRQRFGLALEIVGTALAYAVKEQAVVLPAFAAVEGWVAMGRPALDRASAVRIARVALPQLAIVGAYLAARTKWLPIHTPGNDVTGIAHLEHVLETMGRFFVLAFAPHDLSVQQGLVHTTAVGIVFDKRYIALGAFGIVALATAAIAMRKKNPVFAVGIAFFFITILPTSNVVNTGMMTMLSERFLYLPLLGLALAAGALLANLLDARLSRPVLYATLALTAILAVVAARRANDFNDDQKFWARELRLHPDSLDAHRAAIAHATEAKRYELALRITASAQQAAFRFYMHTGYEFDFIEQALMLVARLTPDHDQDSLRKIDRFLAAVLDPHATTATCAVRGIETTVPLGKGVIAHRADALRTRLLADRADLASRLGDDPSAVPLIEQALAGCPGCDGIGKTAALIQARAGRYPEAFITLDAVAARQNEESVKEIREALRRADLARRQAALAEEGPVRLKLRADELAALEAWGRAYDVLAPFKDHIKLAPGFAYGFAELAWRAGEPEVAREVLGGVVPAEKVDPLLYDWSKKMGWLDSR